MNWIFSGVAAFVLSVQFLFLPVSAEGYTVIEKNGYVAVKTENGEIAETDAVAAMLPQSDRERLERGIACADERELARVIEALCS